MQETIPENSEDMEEFEKRIEHFEGKSSMDLLGKMNDRLMKLQEEEGEVLNKREFTFSEKRAIEKAKKTQKKINRLKKKMNKGM